MTTKEILDTYKTIAIVGFSKNPERDSHEIASHLKNLGYKVYGVNPVLGGQEIDGIKCYNTLADIDEKIDIVDIFRKGEFIPEIVEQANRMKIKPAVIWAQLGIRSEEAAKLAAKYGFEYIEDKCIYMEYKFNH